jgi:hypothetical protein
MAETKRRRWLQLHLSTCIVLMFVAGGLIWANVRLQEPAPPPDAQVDDEQDEMRYRLEHYVWQYTEPHTRGWPWVAWQRSYKFQVTAERNDGRLPEGIDVESADWSYGNLAADGAVSITILFTIAFFLEWLIRRRGRQQP